jgi:hypothetical protein
MIGKAASYDVRYSAKAITPDNFDSAHSASAVPAPATAGTAESFRLSGVPSAGRYLAVRAVDGAGNLGAEVTVRITG